MFEWSWDSVASECTNFLGPAGYGLVQVSPAAEHVTGPQWWTDYQPVSYTLTSKRGNRTQYANMIETCHTAGVGVIADTIFNHMSGETSGVGVAGSINYDNELEVWTCQLDGLADLATDTEYVRGRLAEYANDLLSLGIDGMRLDASKSNYLSPIPWTSVQRIEDINVSDIANILSRLTSVPYITQEVIYGEGQPVTPNMYIGNGDVQEFTTAVQSAFTGNTPLTSLQDLDNQGWVPSDLANIFVSGGSLNYNSSSNGYVLATILSLAHSYGTPTVLSSYEFTSYDQGAPNGGYCFRLLHRWLPFAGMVTFRNSVTGNITQFASGTSQQIAFGRGAICTGTSGFVVINNEDFSWTATFSTSLPAGVFCDVITGPAKNGICSGSSYAVSSTGTFSAVVGPRNAIAIHIGALSSTPTATTATSVPSTTGGLDIVTVNFHETVTTVFGDNIFVVGSISELGNWSPASAIPLSATDYPIWKASVVMPSETDFQYKFIRITSSGDTPAALKTWRVVTAVCLMISLAIGLEVALVFSNKRGGEYYLQFNPFGRVQVYSSFIPTLSITVLAWYWRSLDRAYRRMQPYLNMSQGPTTAQESVLLDLEHTTLPKLFRFSLRTKNFLVLISTALALLGIFYHPLASSLFLVKAVSMVFPAETHVQSLATLGLNPQSADLSSFVAAAGFAEAATFYNLGDLPFVRGPWAVARFQYPSSVSSNSTVTVNTTAIETILNCTSPSVDVIPNPPNTTLQVTIAPNCTRTVIIDPASSTSQYGVQAITDCAGGDTDSPEFAPALFWFYTVGSGTGQLLARAVFCDISLKTAAVETTVDGKTGLLTDLNVIGEVGFDSNNITSGAFSGNAFNGIAFESTSADPVASFNLSNPFIAARALAVQTQVPGTIFRFATDTILNPGGFTESGILNITQNIYTQYLSVIALEIVLFFVYRRRSRNVHLGTRPGFIAHCMSIIPQMEVNPITPTDTKQSLKRKLDNMQFMLDEDGYIVGMTTQEANVRKSRGASWLSQQNSMFKFRPEPYDDGGMYSPESAKFSPGMKSPDFKSAPMSPPPNQGVGFAGLSSQQMRRGSAIRNSIALENRRSIGQELLLPHKKPRSGTSSPSSSSSEEGQTAHSLPPGLPAPSFLNPFSPKSSHREGNSEGKDP
ncbi:hypothetical protein Clacol_007250 [Clathrus columnatus]|uniref:alpha-amylase n=1 Tax=Clathrus columnatus TaxID=1419009 RepID=A0AAV5AJ87_9AGAM|nr:hypothetical protein Clacol_007250 [Clathrus columnatus]